MTNTFEIEYNGEKIPLLFGNWMNGQLTKEGFDINPATFSQEFFTNPYLVAPFVFYLAACNAKNFRRDDYDEKTFLMYCEDRNNINNIAKGLNIFYRSIFGDAFIDSIENKEGQKNEEVKEVAKKKVTRKKVQ